MRRNTCLNCEQVTKVILTLWKRVESSKICPCIFCDMRRFENIFLTFRCFDVYLSVQTSLSKYLVSTSTRRMGVSCLPKELVIIICASTSTACLNCEQVTKVILTIERVECSQIFPFIFCDMRRFENIFLTFRSEAASQGARFDVYLSVQTSLSKYLVSTSTRRMGVSCLPKELIFIIVCASTRTKTVRVAYYAALQVIFQKYPSQWLYFFSGMVTY